MDVGSSPDIPQATFRSDSILNIQVRGYLRFILQAEMQGVVETNMNVLKSLSCSLRWDVV